MFKKAIILLYILFIGNTLWAKTAVNNVPKVKVMDIDLLDGNEFNMYISNYGKFGQSPQGKAGAWWPSNRKLETYIYGAGPWIGAITRDGDTVVTFFYNPSYGQSEGVPAHIADPGDLYNYTAALGDPYDRVHIYGKTTEQGYEWPLKTASGEDSVVSNMDSYEAFMDIAPEYQESGSRPLGLYIVEQTYQWAVPGLDNIIFNIYEIENISGDTLFDVYAGITYDDDIGNESGENANDLVGFVRSYTFPGDTAPTLLNLAYQYQTEPEEDWIGVDGNGLPGVIGSVFLESPIATDTVVVWDTIGTHVGPDTVLPGEPLGMTAFKIFTIAIDPRTDPERYTIMAGYDPSSAGGAYNPYMDDVYGPGDKRFIQVSGPFTMAPGQKERLVSAILVGKDTVDILYAAQMVKMIYQNNFIGPKGPDQPEFFANSRDNKVYLWWNDVSEKSKDPFYTITHKVNPMYREMDFQGYLLLRSIDNNNWDTLAIYDLSDGIAVVYTDSLYDPEGNYYVYTDSLFLGHDSGIKHYYVDSTVIPGLVYSYKLIPFDFNYGDYTIRGTDTVPTKAFSLKGVPATVSVLTLGNTGQPHCKANVTKYGLENIFQFDGIEHFARDTNVLNDTFKLIFSYHGSSDSISTSTNPAFPMISITLVNKLNDTLLIIPANNITWMYIESDSFGNIYTANMSLDLMGWTILNPRLIWENNYYASYKIGSDLFAQTTNDSSTWKITKISTNWSYTPDSLSLISNIANPAAYIYPAVYKITWKYNSTGDSITLQVYDTLRKVYVPYNPDITRMNSDYGWAFIQGVTGNPSFGAAEWIPVNATIGPTGIYGIKLPGSKVFELTDFGGSATAPLNGSEWVVETYDTTNKVNTLPISGEYYLITFRSDSITNRPIKQHDIFAYFNVQTKKITLDLPETLENEGILQIYDLTGRLVNKVNLCLREDRQIPGNKLQRSGVYFYVLKNRKGQIQSFGKMILIK